MEWVAWVILGVFAANVVFIGGLFLISTIRERREKHEQRE